MDLPVRITDIHGRSVIESIPLLVTVDGSP
jgi:expansin (peptidoglycan-binding protein)